MRRFGNFVAGAFFGALIGSAVGILLAPRSGDELRKTAIDRVVALRDEIRQAYETRRSQLEAELEALRASK
jgi:gas vesicle protein